MAVTHARQTLANVLVLLPRSRGGEDEYLRAEDVHAIPSDTKFLLTKNSSEMIVFGKLRISRVIP